ncbi:MAG: DsrE family protein [Nitrospinae bacterium]|nr:DsrE family protein [Nitrospinota bacterium]
MHEQKGVGKKLGILLTTSPESENTFTVIKLSESALASGKDVHIFLMCDGVYNIHNEDFVSLVNKGASITLCAHNASERHVEEREGINFGSQYDHAHIVNESDRFLSFT